MRKSPVPVRLVAPNRQRVAGPYDRHAVGRHLTHAPTHANPVLARLPMHIWKGSDGFRRSPLHSDPADWLGNPQIVARPAGLEPATPGLERRCTSGQGREGHAYKALSGAWIITCRAVFKTDVYGTRP